MICFVDMEHEQVRYDEFRWQASMAWRLETQYRLEDLSGLPGITQRMDRVTPERLWQWSVRALFLSGHKTEWERYNHVDVSGLTAVVKAAEIPIFAICGGAQFVARVYGSEIVPLRPLSDGEEDTWPEFGPGQVKELGFGPIQVLRPDPLFAGMSAHPIIYHTHYMQIAELPPGFELLASTDLCRIQVMRHHERPIYAVQFHPEQYDAEHGDGRTLIVNFLCLAGVLQPELLETHAAQAAVG